MHTLHSPRLIEGGLTLHNVHTKTHLIRVAPPAIGVPGASRTVEVCIAVFSDTFCPLVLVHHHKDDGRVARDFGSRIRSR
jgi:hypothetical protein